MFNIKHKEKFNQLKDNPGALFGLLYPYILVIVLGVGLYYLDNISNVAKQNVPPRIATVPVLEDLAFRKPQVISPMDVNEMIIPNDIAIETGKQLFKTICASCHGEEGSGTGPASVGLNPTPRNLTNHNGWVNGETVSGIYTTLQEGIPNSAMVSYDYLTPEEKFGLAHYIRSAFINDPPNDEASELSTLDNLYNLSKGDTTSGQISTEYAMTLIAEQNNPKILKVEYAIDYIRTDKVNNTVVMIENVTDNLPLALSALVNSDKWRKSESSLKSFITLNINYNGFNGNIINLSRDEWNKIYNYLNKIL